MRQELTAPVAAIVGYAEILREESSDDSCEEFVSDLKQIFTQNGSDASLPATVDPALSN